MKKIYLLILLVVTVILTGCSSSILKKISLDDLNSKIKNNESFIIYFAKDEDTKLQQKLEKVLEENNLEGYLIDTNKISNEEKNKLQLTIDYENNSIIFIINGKDPSKLSHVTDEETGLKQITERLKDMKFIVE